MKRFLFTILIPLMLLTTGSSGWADVDCKEPSQVAALKLAILSSSTISAANYVVKRNGGTVEQSSTAMTGDGTNNFYASYTIPGSPTTFGDWFIEYAWTDGACSGGTCLVAEYMPVKAAGTCGTSGTQLVDATKISGDQTAADNLELAYDGTGYKDIDNQFVVTTGTATAGAASTITLVSPASTTAQAYKDYPIRIISGTGAGQVRWISDYTTGRVATVYIPWLTTPDATSVYVVDYVYAASGKTTCTLSGSPTATVFTVACIDSSGGSISLATDKFVGALMRADNKPGTGTACNVAGESIFIGDVTSGGVVTVRVSFPGAQFSAAPNITNCILTVEP